MSEPLIYGLLAGALVVPVLGALLLRLLTNRIPESVINGGAVVLFLIAIVSVLVLMRSDITSMRVGNLTLLLPLTERGVQTPADIPTPLANNRQITAQPGDLQATTIPTSTTMTAAATIPTTPTVTTTTTVTATATMTITATPTVTTTVIEAPAKPTEPPAEPDEPQTYTLQPGDTLFDLAIRFDVSIEELLEANNFTEEEAENLQPGDELRIP